MVSPKISRFMWESAIEMRASARVSLGLFTPYRQRWYCVTAYRRAHLAADTSNKIAPVACARKNHLLGFFIPLTRGW